MTAITPMDAAEPKVLSSRYGGVVADFMDLGIKPARTGIFDVADMTILAGALGLVGGSVHARSRGI